MQAYASVAPADDRKEGIFFKIMHDLQSMARVQGILALDVLKIYHGICHSAAGILAEAAEPSWSSYTGGFLSTTVISMPGWTAGAASDM